MQDRITSDDEKRNGSWAIFEAIGHRSHGGGLFIEEKAGLPHYRIECYGQADAEPYQVSDYGPLALYSRRWCGEAEARRAGEDRRPPSLTPAAFGVDATTALLRAFGYSDDTLRPQLQPIVGAWPRAHRDAAVVWAQTADKARESGITPPPEPDHVRKLHEVLWTLPGARTPTADEAYDALGRVLTVVSSRAKAARAVVEGWNDTERRLAMAWVSAVGTQPTARMPAHVSAFEATANPIPF